MLSPEGERDLGGKDYALHSDTFHDTNMADFLNKGHFLFAPASQMMSSTLV